MEQPELSCLSSEELASQARAGSAECFAELVKRHSGGLFSLLYRKVSNRHDAEDLSQETFSRAYQRISQYQPRYKFATWLFTIGWRLACSFHRGRNATVELPLEGTRDDLAGRPAIAADERENLWTMVGDMLPKDQSLALWHRYGEGMSVTEIAARMNKSEINVKVLLHRARTRLAGQLNRDDWSGGVK